MEFKVLVNYTSARQMVVLHAAKWRGSSARLFGLQVLDLYTTLRIMTDLVRLQQVAVPLAKIDCECLASALLIHKDAETQILKLKSMTTDWNLLCGSLTGHWLVPE